MPGGRISEYKPEYAEQVIDYFTAAASAPPRELAPTTQEESGTTERGAKSVLKTEVRRICAELPTFEGFGRSIGYSTQTLWKWREQYPEFAEACARAKDIQKELLIDRGLTRQYDPSAFVFVAQNITDMRASQASVSVDLSGLHITALQQRPAYPLPKAGPTQLASSAQHLVPEPKSLTD